MTEAPSAKIRLDFFIEMHRTIKEALADGVTRLKKARVSEPELSARLLLQHVLNKSTSELHLSSNYHLDDNEEACYRELINKRCKHMPVQYLVGEVDFYNVKLKVDERVLIPRPETEELVDHLLKLIGGRRKLEALDIGTGSGNIAIALAANIDDVRIVAVDVSADALNLARENASMNNVADKINFICDDCMHEQFWSKIGEYDIIVSNPPYVEEGIFESLQPDVKLYEPKSALIANGNELKFYEAILRQAGNILKHPGIMCFEIGMGQEERVALLVKRYFPKAAVAVINDLAGIPRIISAEND